MRNDKGPAARGSFEWLGGATGSRILRARNVIFPTALALVHAEYALKLTSAGRGAAIHYRGAEHAPCAAGIPMVLEPFEPIVSGTSLSRTSFVTLLIEPRVMGEASEVLGRGGHPRFESLYPRLHRDALIREMAALHHEAVNSASTSEWETRVCSVLELLLESEGGARISGGFRAVRRARELILDRLSENVALSDLECGLSRFHLMRLFRNHFGMTVHGFRIHARIALARTLLARGGSPAEVASDVGFFDQGHLNRHFRRIVGA